MSSQGIDFIVSILSLFVSRQTLNLVSSCSLQIRAMYSSIFKRSELNLPGQQSSLVLAINLLNDSSVKACLVTPPPSYNSSSSPSSASTSTLCLLMFALAIAARISSSTLLSLESDEEEFCRAKARAASFSSCSIRFCSALTLFSCSSCSFSNVAQSITRSSRTSTFSSSYCATMCCLRARFFLG